MAVARLRRKHRFGLIATISALIVAMLLFTSGIAVADDTPPASDPTTTTTDPAPDPPTTTTDPAPTDTTTPPADSTTAPASTDTSTPADSSTPQADPPPDPTTQQDATVNNTDTSVANTGTNNVAGDGTTTAPTSTVAAAVAAGAVALLGTGDATASGGDTTDSITQTAVAVATQAAHIVITQVAVIVDIGLALANTGADTVQASDTGDGSGISLLDSGDASAVGLSGSTAVTQVVQLLAGDNTTQTASVTNVGISVGNSGANNVVGQMSGMEPDGTAVAVSWGPPDASLMSTGAASAVGDLTHTTIIQVAMATASADGTITITQRAVVVNFGAGIANTGVNAAGGSDPTALIVQALVVALLAMLEPGAATSTVSASSAAALAAPGGSGTALIGTGTAIAAGNTTSTSITQLAGGTVSGSQQASAEQNAAVGNFGLAVANTGANIAGAGLSAEESAQLATLPDVFQAFLTLLTDPGTAATWSADMTIGAELLAASATVTMANSLFDLADSSSGNAQVTIHQITGVLHLMLSLANTGANTVTATIGTASAAGTSGASAPAVSSTSNGQVEGLAFLHTGDAQASNNEVTTVCQVINVSAHVCDPPAVAAPPAAPPVAEPAAASVEPVSAATVAKQLAFTGTSSVPFEVAGALVALLLGFLALVARRRLTLVR